MKKIDWSQYQEEEKTPSGSVDWTQFQEKTPEEKEDSFQEQVVRKVAQPAKGAFGFTAPGVLLNLLGTLAQAEAFSPLQEIDEERIAELKEKFPTAPWENFKGLNQESMQQAAMQAAQGAPTVENI